jgi:hypothetical protein
MRFIIILILATISFAAKSQSIDLGLKKSFIIEALDKQKIKYECNDSLKTLKHPTAAGEVTYHFQADTVSYYKVFNKNLSEINKVMEFFDSKYKKNSEYDWFDYGTKYAKVVYAITKSVDGFYITIFKQ